jgi:hypothetical protein
MALILGDVRPQGRQFGDLITMDFTPRLDLLELLGQRLVAVAATHGHHGHGFIDPFGRLQLPVAPRMALLSARLAPAPATRRFQSPRGGWPVG